MFYNISFMSAVGLTGRRLTNKKLSILIFLLQINAEKSAYADKILTIFESLYQITKLL